MSGVIGLDMWSILRYHGTLFAINVNHVNDAPIRGFAWGIDHTILELSKFCAGTVTNHHDWLYTYVVHHVSITVYLP